MSLISNYMSYLTFYKRYKNNLFGITGTLGSKYNTEFLSDQYEVDLGYIPSFKARQLKILKHLIEPN
jgi:hypothetical protein